MAFQIILVNDQTNNAVMWSMGDLSQDTLTKLLTLYTDRFGPPWEVEHKLTVVVADDPEQGAKHAEDQ